MSDAPVGNPAHDFCREAGRNHMWTSLSRFPAQNSVQNCPAHEVIGQADWLSGSSTLLDGAIQKKHIPFSSSAISRKAGEEKEVKR